MDEILEDDKKAFEAETANEDDAQPDPDEHLMLDQGNGRVWLVKIPKYLMERWAAVNAEDIHLATLRVYNPPPDSPNGKTRIILFLPPNQVGNATPPPQNPNRPVFAHTTSYTATGPEPDCYELDMVNESVENQIVVAERPKDSSLSISASISATLPNNTRARTTILTGRIKHECNLRPAFSSSYRRQMKERHLKYNTPGRQIKILDPDNLPGGRGAVNRLTSGMGIGTGNAFGNLIKTKPKQPKGTFERMARMPKNLLLDRLFQLFQETQRWSIRPLRERTQQPEAYLKEVLNDVAFLHKSGEFNGLWELKEIFAREGVKAESIAESSASADLKMEEDVDDEDEDMEEVS